MYWDIDKLKAMNNTFCSAYQVIENRKILDQLNKEQSRKDVALFQTAQASIEQKELLEKQIEEVKQQNIKLEEANKRLNVLYEQAKKDAEDNAKTDKTSKRQANISIGVSILAVGVAIVMGVLGIIF